MKKIGFTLAEVLITLGIIGVVAALTIPTLVNNYQKKTYVTGLQRAYAQLQQVFKLAMAQDSVDLLENTNLIRSINGDNFLNDYDQKEFVSELGKYIKIQKVCYGMDFSNGCHNIEYSDLVEDINTPTNRGGDLQIYMADGTIYYFNGMGKTASFTGETHCNEIKSEGGSMCSSIGHVRIDINGKKGPNKEGRDFFAFEIDGYGKVYPYGATTVYGKSENWSYWGCSEAENDYGGFACAGRIFDQGWKMDY